MTKQLFHKTSPFLKKEFPVILISDGIESPANVGGLFRIGEAFGVQQIIFCNAIIDFGSSRLKRTSRNTENRVKYSVEEDIEAVLVRLIDADYTIVALEITNQSIPLESLVLKDHKIALVIGNERYGVSREVLERIPIQTHIEMFGNNSSMNVVQATGIALYSIINILK